MTVPGGASRPGEPCGKKDIALGGHPSAKGAYIAGNCAHFYTHYEDTATDADHREGMIRVPSITWFTNLEIPKRTESMVLYRKYSPKEYPTYENYDAIDVGTTADIPEDWYGNMGVPDTFLHQYNPEQFEIVGLGCGDLGKQIGVRKNYRGRTDVAYKLDGKDKCLYSSIIIRRRRQEAGQ